jgi:hypothetical protein
LGNIVSQFGWESKETLKFVTESDNWDVVPWDDFTDTLSGVADVVPGGWNSKLLLKMVDEWEGWDTLSLSDIESTYSALDTIGWSNDLTLSVFSEIGEAHAENWKIIKDSLTTKGVSGDYISKIETQYNSIWDQMDWFFIKQSLYESGLSADYISKIETQIKEGSETSWANIQASLESNGASGSVIATIETEYKQAATGVKHITEDSFMDMLSENGASASVLATIKSEMDKTATNALSADSIETMLSAAGADAELIQKIKTEISGEVDVELSDQMKLLNNIASNTFGTLDVLNRILINQRILADWGSGMGMEEINVWDDYWGTGPALIDWSQGAQHGGVFEGPTSGYPMTLHGREAVIPMQHGDDIPVKINRGGNDDEVVGLLRELIHELKKKDTSPKITVAMDKQRLMRDTAKYVNERIERRVIGE